MTARKVVVTGASGFVGSCVVEALFAADGYDVVPTSRRLNGGGRVARFGYRLHSADLTRLAAVDELVCGSDAVVHCAFGGDSDQELATRTLLNAAAAAGLVQFVHMSTTEVYATHEGTVDEDARIQLAGQHYGAVKGRIESLVASRASDFHSTVILRPAIIYGPLSDAWTITPINRLLAGWRPSVKDLEGVGNFIHIADLCRIIEGVLSKPAVGLRVYNVVGPEVVTWADYFRRLAQALGVAVTPQETSTTRAVELGFVRSLLHAVPTGVRRKLVASLTTYSPSLKVVARWKRLHSLEPISAEKALYARTARYSIARLVEAGLAPRVGINDGIQQSAAWARQVGLA